MKKLSKEKIIEINKLFNGNNELELSKSFNVSVDTIKYHTNEEVKNRKKQHSKDYFKNLSIEERKEIYKKRKEYFKEYQSKRYNEDEVYRKRMIDYQKKKKTKEGENGETKRT